MKKSHIINLYVNKIMKKTKMKEFGIICIILITFFFFDFYGTPTGIFALLFDELISVMMIIFSIKNLFKIVHDFKYNGYKTNLIVTLISIFLLFLGIMWLVDLSRDILKGPIDTSFVQCYAYFSSSSKGRTKYRLNILLDNRKEMTFEMNFDDYQKALKICNNQNQSNSNYVVEYYEYTKNFVTIKEKKKI